TGAMLAANRNADDERRHGGDEVALRDDCAVAGVEVMRVTKVELGTEDAARHAADAEAPGKAVALVHRFTQRTSHLAAEVGAEKRNEIAVRPRCRRRDRQSQRGDRHTQTFPHVVLSSTSGKVI